VYEKRENFSPARSEEERLNDRPRSSHQVSHLLIISMENNTPKEKLCLMGEKGRCFQYQGTAGNSVNRLKICSREV